MSGGLYDLVLAPTWSEEPIEPYLNSRYPRPFRPKGSMLSVVASIVAWYQPRLNVRLSYPEGRVEVFYTVRGPWPDAGQIPPQSVPPSQQAERLAHTKIGRIDPVLSVTDELKPSSTVALTSVRCVHPSKVTIEPSARLLRSYACVQCPSLAVFPVHGFEVLVASLVEGWPIK